LNRHAVSADNDGVLEEAEEMTGAIQWGEIAWHAVHPAAVVGPKCRAATVTLDNGMDMGQSQHSPERE